MTEPYPKEERITLRDGTVAIVREMRWRPACAFLRNLGAIAGEIVGFALRVKAERGEKEGEEDAGLLSVDQDTLSGLVQTILNSGDLATQLIESATNLKPAQIEALSFEDGLDLVAAAIPLNVNADVLGKAEAVGASVTRALAGLKPGQLAAATGSTQSTP